MSTKNTRKNSSNPSPFGRPLNAMFLLTSMPIGGAETLLVNLARRFDPDRIQPLIGCMKGKDVLGKEIEGEFPVFENLINHKYDFAVAGRLRKLFKQQNIDALITVGAGDKMFWGRLGARRGAGSAVWRYSGCLGNLSKTPARPGNQGGGGCQSERLEVSSAPAIQLACASDPETGRAFCAPENGVSV